MKKLCASVALISTLLYSGLSSASWLWPDFDSAEEDLSAVVCPSVESIKAQGIQYMEFEQYSFADFSEKGSFTGITESTFGTPYLMWHFQILNIDAKNREEAYTKATQLLNTLSGNPVLTTPYRECYYSLQGNGKNGKPLTARATLVN